MRADGVVAWAPYTDHEPIEVCGRLEGEWPTEIPAETQEAVPNYRALTGSSGATARCREDFARRVSERIMACASPPVWRDVCRIANEVALEVLGKRERRHQIPWLQGHEGTKRRLDEAVSRAELAWREATEEAKPAAVQARRLARRDRRRTLRQLERAYWRDIGGKASAAAQSGDQGTLYRLFRELRTQRGDRGDGGRWSIGDVQAERDKWKNTLLRSRRTWVS